MKKTFVMAALFFCLFGLAVAEEQRVESNVTALEFNEINSQYMPRPTFAELKGNSHGGSKKYLAFEVSGYGKGKAEFWVATEFVDENIEAINKYLKWASMAKDKGDILDKEIATVKGSDQGAVYMWNFYRFHSGNKESHYLIVTQNAKGLFGDLMPVSEPLTFDEENANRLIKRLTEFKNGKISSTNADEYK